MHLQSRNKFQNYFNVIYALCMHDIKTRFFGNGLGQIVMILWPFAHIVLLLLIYTIMGRVAPFGDSLLVYSSVGLIPFFVLPYMSRWIMLSTLQNKAFLQYPIIRLLDIMLARAILEVISYFIVTISLLLILSLLGESSMPDNYAEAASAWGVSIFLALGLGILNGAITALFPLWNIVFVLLLIVAYALSGVLFVVSTLPKFVRDILSWNPMLQTIEWMRSAYYSDYNSLVLDKGYVIRFSFVCLALGLLLERFTRRYRYG